MNLSCKCSEEKYQMTFKKANKLDFVGVLRLSVFVFDINGT